MKILHLVDTLRSGGAERMAVNICNVLSKDKKNSVFLFSTREKGDLHKTLNKNVNFKCLYKKNFFDFKSFKKILFLIKKNKIKIVHVHSNSIFWSFFIKLLNSNIKLIWHDHTGARKEKIIKNFFLRIISLKIDAIICVNKELYEWSCKNMFVNNEKIILLRNFPLLKSFFVGKKEDFLKIVCLANLRKEKDHITLLKAINKIRADYPKIKFKLLLAGMYYNDSYFKEVSDYVKKNKLEKCVEIIGSVSDTSKLLFESDIGVLTSISEGLPVSLLEYGLAKLPVVATDVGYCSEVIDHGKSGFIAQSGDFKSIAEFLLILIKSKQERIKIGNKFNNNIIKNYGHNNFIKKYKNLLMKL